MKALIAKLDATFLLYHSLPLLHLLEIQGSSIKLPGWMDLLILMGVGLRLLAVVL
jgi:hypothetical protein